MSDTESSTPKPPKPLAEANNHRKIPDYGLVALGMFLLLVPLGFVAALPEQYSNLTFYLRVITALGGALVGAAIPGLIEVNLTFARGAGAMGVFLLILYVNPPGLIQPASPPPLPPPSDSIYDDFGKSAFVNTFNPDLWAPENMVAGQIAQHDGILVVTNKAKTQGGLGLIALKHENFTLENDIFIEAKFMVEETQPDSNVHIAFSSDLPSEAYTDCVLGNGDTKASISCAFSTVVGTQDRTVYETSSTLVGLGTWHTVRIELKLSTMMLTYYSDGLKIGSYSPPNTEALKTAKYNIGIGVWADKPSKAVTGYIDDVKIGAIAQ